ncbi:MAG: MATE family efflux transporter, partial [Duncaniella sp.]|nr:MATE family efflux transporter [Duncaniella sp.]
RRIASAGFHLNIILATVFSIIYFVTFRPLVHFFTPDEAVVIQALPLVFPLILYQYCDSTQITFGNALRGTSKVKPLLWISLGCYLAIGIPCMLFMATVMNLGNVGVYYSFSVALLAAAVALFVTFRRTVDKMQFSH